ncbi:MAG: TerB family tellurite resistance protein [Cellvibrionaceae bacterium]|nr:TerB family tellurite resistance protein [Cellvibrionaceae bacterium]
MLASIRDFFQTQLQDAPAKPLDEKKIRLACAALLIEVAVIDNEFDGEELASVKAILHREFDVAEEELDELVTMAHYECSESTSMYGFTQLVNQHCSFAEKFDLITHMWRIAYADGDLDKYEEYLIRKVADLIHLGHGEFIRAKHAARTGL